MNDELYKFINEHKDCAWKPTLPLPQNLWESTWPWVPVLEKINTDACIREMEQIDNYFVQHRDKDKIKSYGHDGWYSLTLHGISHDKTENFDRYGFKSQDEANYHWTDICSLIPNTINLIKAMPFKNYGRIRIMRLSPGGYIMPHVDGPTRVFGPFNFALNNPSGCDFIFENYGKVPFVNGLGFMLDIGIKHCVYNNSNNYRYHIIIHGEPLENIQEHIANAILKL